MCTLTYVYAVISTARLGMPAMRCLRGSQELLREGVPDLAAAHAVLHGVCYNVVAVRWSPNSLNPLKPIHCIDAETPGIQRHRGS